MRITCTVAFWTATYVQWQPITALPSSPGESLGCSRTNSTTCWINFTFSPPSCGKTQNLLWSHLVCEGKGQRGAKLRRAPYGWMRFHRGTLSVAGLNPWAVTVISAAAESEKKFPQLLPLSASDRQSVTEWNAEESAPAPHWPCHILSSHVFLSLHHPSSIHPSALSDVCLYTFTEHHPPPRPAPVATVTADSGRVGGCLSAHAALPHAVLSQDISASVLLLWPCHADSSGGWVTNLSATQRLFVCCSWRIQSGLQFMLLFICFPLQFALVWFFLSWKRDGSYFCLNRRYKSQVRLGPAVCAFVSLETTLRWLIM